MSQSNDVKDSQEFKAAMLYAITSNCKCATCILLRSIGIIK